MLTCVFYLAVLIYGAESVLLKKLNLNHMPVNTSKNLIAGFIANPKQIPVNTSKNLIAGFIANPKQFVAQVANLDPAEVAEIITLLQALMDTSQTREDYLVDTLSQKVAEAQITGNALTVAQDALTTAEGQLTDAEENVDAKTQERDIANLAHVAKTNEKDIAQTEHDAEVGSLIDEQQVLADVIRMLGGLVPEVPTQVPEVPTQVPEVPTPDFYRIWDFEDGMQGFTLQTGTCGNQPVLYKGGPDDRWSHPEGGQYFVNTYPIVGDGARCQYSDKSHVFELTSETKISWLETASGHKICVNEFGTNNELVCAQNSYNSFTMQNRSFTSTQLLEFVGRKCYMSFADTGTGGWEHIQLDNLIVEGGLVVPPEVPEVPTQVPTPDCVDNNSHTTLEWGWTCSEIKDREWCNVLGRALACPASCEMCPGGTLGEIDYCGDVTYDGQTVGLYNSRREHRADYSDWNQFCVANGWSHALGGSGNWNNDCNYVVSEFFSEGQWPTLSYTPTDLVPNRDHGSHIYELCSH